MAESILEGDGQLAFKKLATATLETLMPRIEDIREFGQARWRARVYAPKIPSLLSLDPTVDPLKSLASNISFGAEVEIQLGKRLQVSKASQFTLSGPYCRSSHIFLIFSNFANLSWENLLDRILRNKGLLHAGVGCEADEGFRDGYAVDLDLPADKSTPGATAISPIQASHVRIFYNFTGLVCQVSSRSSTVVVVVVVFWDSNPSSPKEVLVCRASLSNCIYFSVHALGFLLNRQKPSIHIVNSHLLIVHHSLFFMRIYTSFFLKGLFRFRF